MHTSAYKTAEKFFRTYCNFGKLKVVEIGSQNVNGTMRDHAPPNIIEYIGLDFAEGNGVDIVLTDPYKFPINDQSVDVVITSSCFEHSEMFWMSYLEALRILKPTGLLYVNAPSSWMAYHRHPFDLWRFYPDAAKGLETWGKYNNIDNMVLESFIHPPTSDEDVCDWVAVFLKDSKFEYLHANRMIDSLVSYEGYFNGFRFPVNDKFPHGWSTPTAIYHQAVKNKVVLGYSDFKY